MPTYKYECQKCENQWEEVRKIDDRRVDVICPGCGCTLFEIIPSATDHILKGVGWARDNYKNKRKGDE